MNNPFLTPYTTPFEAIPFDRIELQHILPAINEGIKAENSEIEAITANSEAPDFENTIHALDKCGSILSRVTSVLGTYMNSCHSAELQNISEEAYTLLTEHNNNIYLNEQLFARIKQVYDSPEEGLNGEQQRLLETTYKSFERAGANLTPEQKEKYRELTQSLNKLELKFQENSLNETDAYTLHISDATQLAGLPEGTIETAAETAKEHGKEGWIFTLHRPSYIPFLTFSTNRELRKELYLAYSSLGAKGDK